MHADLIRVYNGEAPEAPKVLTDADRTAMLRSSSAAGAGPHTDPLPRQPLDFSGDRNASSVTRWLVAVAVLAVLTVAVTVVINLFSGGGRAHELAVPDVQGMVSADAVAELQKKGFEVRTEQKADSVVPPDHVISTDPAADSIAHKGD